MSKEKPISKDASILLNALSKMIDEAEQDRLQMISDDCPTSATIYVMKKEILDVAHRELKTLAISLKNRSFKCFTQCGFETCNNAALHQHEENCNHINL